jgi:hypothetical protein
MDSQTSDPAVGQALLTHPDPQIQQYRQLICQILRQSAHSPANGTIQTVPILDTERDHYQLLDIGWDESGQRVFQPIVHVDILNGKVWIQENATEVDMAKQLVAAGVAPSNIVLGLHSPTVRRFSDYALE